MYEELVKEGILVQYPKTPLKDYLGEYSYLGTTLRQANIEPMPSLSDVRRVITEYCILPLGRVFHLLGLSYELYFICKLGMYFSNRLKGCV